MTYLEAAGGVHRSSLTAEVVAATGLEFKPAAKLPEDVAWLDQGKKPPGAELVRKRTGVVTRILKDSELKELWAESDDLALWLKEVQSLLHRLS